MSGRTTDGPGEDYGRIEPWMFLDLMRRADYSVHIEMSSKRFVIGKQLANKQRQFSLTLH